LPFIALAVVERDFSLDAAANHRRLISPYGFLEM
jgi:hypothetical protein